MFGGWREEPLESIRTIVWVCGGKGKVCGKVPGRTAKALITTDDGHRFSEAAGASLSATNHVEGFESENTPFLENEASATDRSWCAGAKGRTGKRRGGRARVMWKKRCSHGKQKAGCVQCNPCSHGKLKRICAACNLCAHGKRKHDCTVCNPCSHGKVKRRCAACNPCPHGMLKSKCAACTPCPHGKRKSSCAECNPCPHGKRKYDCAECSPCSHGKLKRMFAACKSSRTERSVSPQIKPEPEIKEEPKIKEEPFKIHDMGENHE